MSVATRLVELLDLLKSKGVASYSGTLDGQPVSVAFMAEPARPMLPLPSQFGEAEAEVCACGHEVVGEHNHEGCLKGCDSEDCAPSKKKRSRKGDK